MIARVDGKIYVQPAPLQFEFYGKGEGASTSGWSSCPSVQMVVSSKGFGGCALVAGFEYFWDDGLSVFAGCDMEDSDLRISSLYRAFERPSGAPPSWEGRAWKPCAFHGDSTRSAST